MGPHLSKVRREELEEHQEQAMLQGKEVEDWLTSPAKKSKQSHSHHNRKLDNPIAKLMLKSNQSKLQKQGCKGDADEVKDDVLLN